MSLTSETQIYLLRTALAYLVWTKKFKEEKGKSKDYEKHREKAWKKAEVALDVVREGKCPHPFESVISVGPLHNCTLCGENIYKEQ